MIVGADLVRPNTRNESFLLEETHRKELLSKIDFQNDTKNKTNLLNEIIERTITFAQTKGIKFDITSSQKQMLNQYMIGDIINQTNLMKYDFPSIV